MTFKDVTIMTDDVDKNFRKFCASIPDGICIKPVAFSGTINDSKFYSEDMLDFLLGDVIKDKAKEVKKKVADAKEQKNRDIIDQFNRVVDKVIFNDPATIIVLKNGEKIVVKCQPGDVYDKEKGLALALVKFAFGNTNYFNTIFKKWLPEDSE